MDLKIHTLGTAPAGSRELLEGIKGDLGFVPNLAASVAESPALLAGFDGLRRAVHSGELPAADREIAGAAVYALAREIVVNRGNVDPVTIARVIGAGLTPASILEIVAECTFAGLVGVVDNLADHVELDEPFVPRAWT